METDVLLNVLYHSAASWDRILMKHNYIAVQQHRPKSNELS
jgi:hypothetical protein